jgi:hypothetical protein
LVAIKKAIDLDDAGVDRCLPMSGISYWRSRVDRFLSLVSSATMTEVFPRRQNQRHDTSCFMIYSSALRSTYLTKTGETLQYRKAQGG